ncbi:MAG: DUF2817 domain-containing protein, partial [Myxococcota bacterium]
MPSLRTLPQDLRLFAKYHLVRRSVTYPARETELGHQLIDYDPVGFAERILGYGDRFAVTTLTELSYEGNSYPMLRVSIVPPGAPKKKLLVLSGVHGNEHAGIVSIPRVLDAMVSEPKAYAHLEVHIITPVNPVGAAENSRYNADGYDINRDFSLFLTAEAKQVEREFKRVEPDLVLSLHEGPQEGGAFLFANSFVPEALA